MTKKITALLLSLLMLGTLATAQTFDYTGTWYLTSIESQGVSINPADMGMEMILTINADGTGLASSTSEEDTLTTWTLDGDVLTVTADDEPLALTLTEEGTLAGEQDGAMMIFGREPAVAGFAAAPEIMAEDISAFDGTWNIIMVNAYGMVVPFAAMAESGQPGMDNAFIVIDNGSVTSFDAAESVAGTLEEGKLVVPSELGEEFAQTISLLEDGTLSLNMMGIIFYCEMTEIVE